MKPGHPPEKPSRVTYQRWKEQTCARLRDEITSAFDTREYPGDYSLTHCPYSEALDLFQGKSWQDLLKEGMSSEHRDYQFSLCPRGWRYFFPALAILALDLDHPAEISDVLTFNLRDHPEQLGPLLRPRERLAVVHLLEYLDVAEQKEYDLSGISDARTALDEYWGRFEYNPDARSDFSSDPRPVPRHTIQEIGRAFEETFRRKDPHPGEVLPAVKPIRMIPEAYQARCWLHGKSWHRILKEGVPDEALVAFLEPDTLLYYFPAFAKLAFDLEAHYDLATTLLCRLWTFPEEINALLLPRERHTIVRWLEAMASLYRQHGFHPNDAQSVLDEFWAYFSDEELYSDPAPPLWRDFQPFVHEIQEAFKARWRPDDRALADRKQFEDLADALESWLQGKSWRALWREGIPTDRVALLPGLKPKAWLYFFPAFAFLSFEPEAKQLSSLVFDKLAHSPQAVKPLCDPKELRAISNFVEFWLDLHKRNLYGRELPWQALAHHWQ